MKFWNNIVQGLFPTMRGGGHVKRPVALEYTSVLACPLSHVPSISKKSPLVTISTHLLSNYPSFPFISFVLENVYLMPFTSGRQCTACCDALLSKTNIFLLLFGIDSAFLHFCSSEIIKFYYFFCYCMLIRDDFFVFGNLSKDNQKIYTRNFFYYVHLSHSHSQAITPIPSHTHTHHSCYSCQVGISAIFFRHLILK